MSRHRYALGVSHNVLYFLLHEWCGFFLLSGEKNRNKSGNWSDDQIILREVSGGFHDLGMRVSGGVSVGCDSLFLLSFSTVGMILLPGKFYIAQGFTCSVRRDCVLHKRLHVFGKRQNEMSNPLLAHPMGHFLRVIVRVGMVAHYAKNISFIAFCHNLH
jgi:hypothetical protein